MTYNVFSGTLTPAQSINQLVLEFYKLSEVIRLLRICQSLESFKHNLKTFYFKSFLLSGILSA